MNVMKFFVLLTAFATAFPAIAAEEHFSVPTETFQSNDDDVPQPKDGHLIGKVLDRNGVPLPGVAVMVKGTNVGTMTNSVGNYDLYLNGHESGTIVFSCLGYAIQEITYSGQMHMNVTLQDDAQLINEVVVTGYGNYNRSEYVGAVTQIKADEILIPGEATIDQMLQGVIPGMSVINTTGKVGGTPKIRIRGTSTILGNQEPLWVVDGVIQTNPVPVPNDASPISGDMEDLAQTAGNAISWLNPADIESITVLKDAASTAIYGSQAANGVIVITTKKATGVGLSVNYSGNVSVGTEAFIRSLRHDELPGMDAVPAADVRRQEPVHDSHSSYRLRRTYTASSEQGNNCPGIRAGIPQDGKHEYRLVRHPFQDSGQPYT